MCKASALRHEAWRVRQLSRTVEHDALKNEFEAMARKREQQAAAIEETAGQKPPRRRAPHGFEGVLAFGLALLVVLKFALMGAGYVAVALLAATLWAVRRSLRGWWRPLPSQPTPLARPLRRHRAF